MLNALKCVDAFGRADRAILSHRGVRVDETVSLILLKCERKNWQLWNFDDESINEIVVSPERNGSPGVLNDEWQCLSILGHHHEQNQFNKVLLLLHVRLRIGIV